MQGNFPRKNSTQKPNQHFPLRFALTAHGRVEGKVNHSCFNKHLHCQWFSEYYIFKYQQPLVFFLYLSLFGKYEESAI